MSELQQKRVEVKTLGVRLEGSKIFFFGKSLSWKIFDRKIAITNFHPNVQDNSPK